MPQRYPLTITEYDLALLGEELKARVGGMGVFVIDGQLGVIGPDKEEIAVDPAIVADVMAKHKVPKAAPSALEELATTLAASGGTQAQKLAAVAKWARVELEERRQRGRA